jgi:hypothetical protein
MRLYYAFGGGLGHLSRTTAVIKTLGLSAEDFILLSNSSYAGLVFDPDKIIHVPESYYGEPDELKRFIQSIIIEYDISEFYIDTFPCGIIGELKGLIVDNIFYIARILNWANYLPLSGNSKLYFDNTFVIEPLPTAQNEFVKQNSKDFIKIDLLYPQEKISQNLEKILATFKKPPWLIVHSEPFEELQLLYQHALEIAEIEGESPEFLVISQAKEKLNGDNILQINYFPAYDFFPYSDKIFTACGFNCMYQTIPFANKHYFIPFIRRFDDQFLRAKNRKQIIAEN